jgi:hypothetical protein
MKISQLFDVKYGTNLELNALEVSDCGIPFVSRTARNNGVSAYVKPILNLEPNPAMTISVAGGGSVLESFLQPLPYYSGRDMYVLIPKVSMQETELLFYCMCLKANQFKYNYGRQANRTLKDIEVPEFSHVPKWVKSANITKYELSNQADSIKQPLRNIAKWIEFKLSDLFTIEKGKRLTKSEFIKGQTPFIGAVTENNGITDYIQNMPRHQGGVITVNYNGNGVAEAFYQEKPFWCSDDVNVLIPKNIHLNIYIALFICTVIKHEKFRFSYGRKWNAERMSESKIRLPEKNGKPDIKYMEQYIKGLPYSASLNK